MIKSIIAWSIVAMLLISALKWVISHDTDDRTLSEWWSDEE